MTIDGEIDVRQRLEAGRQRFLGVELLCGPGALVPRPETELLGRTAIETLRGAAPHPHVIDMCCGVGNLACAIATAVPTARVWASDLTDACVDLTRRNVDHLALADRVVVAQGDLFAPLAPFQLDGTIDLVMCNPPYLSANRLAAGRATLLEYEPREAFDGGPYGLSIHQRLVADAPRFLKPGGWLLMEFGLGQERQVRLVLDRVRRYGSLRFEHDANGAPRVVAAQLQA